VGLSAVTGVFSRYFVVAFFLPAYVGLIGLWVTASSAFIPDLLDDHSQTTQLVILGGVALVAGLVLSGLNYPLTRAFEGYPLMGLQRIPVVRRIPGAAIRVQRWSYMRLRRVYEDRSPANRGRRRLAAATLDWSFPADPADLLPTRVGNAMRAYEQHSNQRWGLDGITIWPRIELLMSAEERELLTDAQTDLFVLLNAAAVATAVGICLIVDKATNGGGSSWALYLVPFALSYLLYRASIRPARRRGSVVRASIDLHRLEIYEKVGLRAPTSLADERHLAVRLNQFLLYGNPPLEDDLWATNPKIADKGHAPGCDLLGRIAQRIKEAIP
jgi:hypothetical protein